MRDCVNVAGMRKCSAGEEITDCDEVRVAVRSTVWERFVTR